MLAPCFHAEHLDVGRAELLVRHLLSNSGNGRAVARLQRVVNAGRVDQLALQTIEVKLGREIVAGRARLIGDNGIAPSRQGIEESALAGVRRAGQHHTDAHGRLAAKREFLHKLIDLCGGLVKLPQEFLGGDERQVFVREVKAGFEVGEQFQQLAAELLKRAGQSSGKLLKCGVEFRRAGRVDHSQHGLGLGQVNSSGQKRAKRELARFGRPCTAGTCGPYDAFQQRRRTEGVDLGHRLPRVAPLAGPEIEFARQR